MPDMKRSERELFSGEFATTKTRGRVKQLKPPDEFRTEFQRDIHRIIYSQAFRRLRYKTQVFYFPRNEHVSTRMDHVLFVSAAARTVARCLRLNEDLAEAIGLAHDIGHPPFGHQGERFLNEIINRKGNENLKRIMPHFHHEVYGLRIVDKIAKRDRERAGLNLTWEVRDGIISHCGEDFATCKLEPQTDKAEDLEAITSRSQAGLPATMEGCIVRLIDKVAYCGKDIEDALAADIIAETQIPGDIIEKLGKTNGQIVGSFVEDMIRESFGKNYIAVTPKYGDLLHKLIEFNNKNIYHSAESEGYRDQAKRTVDLLFKDLLKELRKSKRFTDSDFEISPKTPAVHKFFSEFVLTDMRDVYKDSDPDELIVLDFVAGMTDGFVVRSFQELFIPQAAV